MNQIREDAMQSKVRSTRSQLSYTLAAAFSSFALTIPGVSLGETSATSSANWYWVVIAALVLLVVLVIALLGAAMLLKGPNGEVQPHAFGLPPGTIRALLAISLVVTFIVLAIQFAVDKPPAGDLADKVFIAVSTALATVLGFYFGSGGAKQAAEEMSKALGKPVGAVGNESSSLSAETAAKVAQAATNRAKNAHAKIIAKLEAAKQAKDPKAGMLELDVADVQRTSAKATAAATSAAARATEIAKLSRDLADTAVAAQRKAIETKITEIMARLMADASDAEALADKAEKILARQATA